MDRYRFWAYSDRLLRQDLQAESVPTAAFLGEDGRWRPHEGPGRRRWRRSDGGDEISVEEAVRIVGELGLPVEALTDPRLAPTPLWPQAPTRIGVIFKRSSVAYGDDTWAPHTWAFDVDTLTMWGELAEIAINARYLAAISGGRASWVMQNTGGRALAVFAQQWSVPRWMVDPATYVIQTPDAYDDARERAQLHFDYRKQIDPDALFQSLIGLEGGREFDNVFARSGRAQPERPPATS